MVNKRTKESRASAESQLYSVKPSASFHSLEMIIDNKDRFPH
jgi:hypothetical protein